MADFSSYHKQRIARIHSTRRYHRVMTQGYRWFQLFESGMGDIESHLELHMRNVAIDSSFGTCRGITEYEGRLRQLSADWKNSYHLRGLMIHAVDEAGDTRLDMDVVYQNLGQQDNDALLVQRIEYTAILGEYGNALLPRFRKVATTPSWHRVPHGFETFAPTLADHRLRSLVHYWFALLDSQECDVASFTELLTDDHRIDLFGNTLTVNNGFGAFLRAESDEFRVSGHYVQKVEFSRGATPHSYVVDLDLYWNGYKHGDDNSEYHSTMRQQWIVSDNVTDRFPRIRSITGPVVQTRGLVIPSEDVGR